MVALRDHIRSAQDDGDEVDPFAEFVVFEDGSVPNTRVGTSKSPPVQSPQANDQTVIIRRSVIYLQGTLLGLVALVAFAFGILFAGGDNESGPQDDTAEPSILTGKLTYDEPDRQGEPDIGSVAIILPVDHRPDEKISPDGLRPDEPPPDPDHESVSAIRGLGGAYARADFEGVYELEIPRSGRFFVLFISGAQERADVEFHRREDLAQLGRFFVRPTKLLGKNQYQWREQSVHGNQVLDHRFKQANE